LAADDRDHVEPTLLDLQKACCFYSKIQRFLKTKRNVYVHCRVGHGRSAAVVMAWLLSQEKGNISLVDLQTINEKLGAKRHVRTKLWKQKDIIQFRDWFSY